MARPAWPAPTTIVSTFSTDILPSSIRLCETSADEVTFSNQSIGANWPRKLSFHRAMLSLCLNVVQRGCRMYRHRVKSRASKHFREEALQPRFGSLVKKLV